jgi:NAD(P)H-dependent FMN reductase
METAPIRVVIINGSVRPRNYTAMASALVLDELKKYPEVSAEFIDQASLNLPFPGTRPDAEGTRVLQQKVRDATGVVLATPEYHGSLSSVMKLVIENLGFSSALAREPLPPNGNFDFVTRRGLAIQTREDFEPAIGNAYPVIETGKKKRFSGK